MVNANTGTVFFVDGSSSQASNSNDGSEASPWKTIQHAANQAQPGDTIYVKAGTYDPFEIVSSGTEDNPIVFSAYPGDEHQVIVDGTGEQVRGVIMARGESHFTVSGFRVENAKTDGIFVEGSPEGERGINILDNVVDTTGNSGIYAAGLIMGRTIPVDEYRLFDLRIEGNEVTNTNFPNGGNEAITVGGGVDGFVITDNWVHNSEQYGIDIKLGVRNGEISNNLIHDIEKHGIYIDSASRTIENVEVYGNEIYNNNNGIVLARESARDPAVPNIRDIDIYDNLVYDNNKYGVMAYKHSRDNLTGDFDDVQVFNNTITGNGIHGVHLKGLGPIAENVVFAGNDINGNGRDVLNQIGAEFSDDLSMIDMSGIGGTAGAPTTPEPVDVVDTPAPAPVQEPQVEDVVASPPEPEPIAPEAQEPEPALDQEPSEPLAVEEATPPEPETDTPVSPAQGDAQTWQAENGRIVIEAENGVAADGADPGNEAWTIETELEGHHGDGYLRWNGPNNYAKGDAGSGTLEYQINVEEAGDYYLSLLASRPDNGEAFNLNNDFWIRTEDGDWNKLFFRGGREEWNWGTRFDTGDGASRAVLSLEEGVNTLQISGRSTDAFLDKIVLSKDKSDLDPDAPETRVYDADTGAQTQVADVQIQTSETAEMILSDGALPSSDEIIDASVATYAAPPSVSETVATVPEATSVPDVSEVAAEVESGTEQAALSEDDGSATEDTVFSWFFGFLSGLFTRDNGSEPLEYEQFKSTLDEAEIGLDDILPIKDAVTDADVDIASNDPNSDDEDREEFPIL